MGPAPAYLPEPSCHQHFSFLSGVRPSVHSQCRGFLTAGVPDVPARAHLPCTHSVFAMLGSSSMGSALAQSLEHTGHTPSRHLRCIGLLNGACPGIRAGAHQLQTPRSHSEVDLGLCSGSAPCAYKVIHVLCHLSCQGCLRFRYASVPGAGRGLPL